MLLSSIAQQTVGYLAAQKFLGLLPVVVRAAEAVLSSQTKDITHHPIQVELVLLVRETMAVQAEHI